MSHRCTKPMIIRDNANEPVQVPCGQCIDCRLEKANQWAVRCVHEAQMHEENCFVTLTYNNLWLPPDRCVDKKVFKNFIRRLRRKYDNQEIRYFASGEYGESVGKRPHYHACLFGIDFPDKYFFRAARPWKGDHFQQEQGYDLYRSPSLEKLWPFGFSTIGELNYKTAGYTARYVMKKITGEPAEGHYNGLTPEFALMSRMPGIGNSWILKYWTDVYPKDFFYLNGHRKRPPRYYDNVMAGLKPKMYEQVKERRKENEQEIDSKRMFEKRQYTKLMTKNLRRNYHESD